MKLSRPAFYLLSFTWGLPLTLCGCFVAAALRLSGKKPERFGLCRSFRVGKTGWGGLELGPFFLRDHDSGDELSAHELGHGIQNCLLGPLMIPLVSIPSAVRYHIRRKRGITSGYDDIWFEKTATKLGKKYLSGRKL